MNNVVDLFCSTCFALPGELCRTKYLVHGDGEVTAVICPTHSIRLIDSQGTVLAAADRVALSSLFDMGEKSGLAPSGHNPAEKMQE